MQGEQCKQLLRDILITYNALLLLQFKYYIVLREGAFFNVNCSSTDPGTGNK